MAIQHQNFVELADRLIKKHGRSVTFNRKTFMADPTEPWKDGTTVTTAVPIKAAFFETTQADFLAVLTQVAGRGDQEVTGIMGNQSLSVLIAAKSLNFAPSPEDTIVDGAVTWEITKVTVEGPGNTPILYTAEVHR